MELAYPDPPLTDTVVRLRPWEPRDTPCVQEAGSDPRIPAGTSVPAVFTQAEGLAFIRRQQERISNDEGVSLAITERDIDRAVGLIFLPRRPQPRVMGMGYWVVPSARGRGLGTRAVNLASAWALRSLGAARIEAWVELHNEPSQRLLSSAGFVREGVLRAFLPIGDRQADVVSFSRILEDLTPDLGHGVAADRGRQGQNGEST